MFEHTPPQKECTHYLEIFLIFLRLGCTSFGGPIAHLGYFRQEFVEKRKWLDEHAYADLVALCQFLPGPASSQVGIALGLSRGGIPGAIASWLGFTLPSAIALVFFGIWISLEGHSLGSGWLHGLKIVAVAVVAQALWGMGKIHSADKSRAAITICAAVAATIIPSSLGQVAVIAASGFFAWAFLRTSSSLPHSYIQTKISKISGAILLSIFFLLLIALPVAAISSNSYAVKLFDSFYRAGSLVFGGGHVVLPLLQSQVVPAGWVSNETFLAGYGAAQAVPGPLFTFAAFLGAASTQSPSAWWGAVIALVAIFLPSFLLIIGILPFWENLRRHVAMKKAMIGINAAVVGLLLAAFYNPVWTSAIQNAFDFCLATVALLLLVFRIFPPWLVVALATVTTGLWLG
jgi:chromate transporter